MQSSVLASEKDRGDLHEVNLIKNRPMEPSLVLLDRRHFSGNAYRLMSNRHFEEAHS